MRWFYCLFIVFFPWIIFSQGKWTWSAIDSLPIATANNAVSEAVVARKKYVYSFGGISSSFAPSAIHQRVFKYDINGDFWVETVPIPDTLGKIGSSVSFVHQKNYLIGGRYIQADSTEIASDKVHVYNPKSDVFEADGSPIPIPVSDHVQAVWRDSLIYIVSGLSHQGIVPAVQVYNVYLDEWYAGTPLPNDELFLRKGASGYILQDTIYYYGGVFDTLNPNIKNHLIRGAINPDNPLEIEWDDLNFNLGSTIYRGACSGFGKYLFWVGGSDKSFSFMPIDTTDSTLILPNKKIMTLSFSENSQISSYNSLNTFMDLKGIASIGGGNWIIAGGINGKGKASKKTFLLHNPLLSSIEKLEAPPHFEVIEKEDYFSVITENIGEISIYDLSGKLLYQQIKNLSDLKIDKSILSNGFLLFIYDDGINIPLAVKKVKVR